MEKIVQYVKNSINVLSQMINSFVGFAFQKDIDPHINFVISKLHFLQFLAHPLLGPQRLKLRLLVILYMASKSIS